MKNRSLLSALFAISLLLAAAGCKKDTSKPAASPQKEEKPAATALSDAASEREESVADVQSSAAREAIMRKWTGDLDGMIQRRFIRILTTYSKTQYFVDQGTQRGLVYDTASLFEEDLNKKLKNKNIQVRMMILPVSHDELIPALLDGRGDIIAAGTMITDPRKQQADFSTPTRSGVSIIAVTAPDAPPVRSIEDLAGREVYLQLSRITPQAVEGFNAELAKKGLPPVKIKPAPEVLADEDILEMVNAGLVKTTLAYDFIAEFWQQVFPKLVLNKSAALKTDGQLAMMIRKNSPQLKAELNGFLARYPEGSAQRNVLLQRYLKSIKYAKAATAKGERNKLEYLIPLFRKYGEKYSLDYLLMLAQGYQESQLDQNAKSHVGAIGVMQIMPATGKDLKVGDIRKLEPNIHGGVKYIRFMIDQYYKDEPMDRLNKGLFTFASYNAGPGRISQLRKKAAARGLDPNKWFNNVELIAAESIGRETVQYVSNIYKYYLAYQMYMEEQQQRLQVKKVMSGKK
jgi:membrane-bound lytic murein transglycosylase MltF